MAKIAPSTARGGQAPAGQGGGAARAPAPPGRHWSRLAFAPVVQRQPDPNVDYFPDRTLAKKLDALLSASPVDVKAILAAIQPLGRDASKVEALEKAYKLLFKKELDAALADKLSGDDLSEVRYNLYAPLPQKEFEEVKETKPGTEAHKGTTASGGEVTLHTGVEYTRPDKSKFPEAFSLGYTGTDTKEARFVQFLWTEVIATLPGQAPAAVSGAAISLSGTIELTTDPTKPKRIVDSIGSSPFYEHAGADIRTATATRIFDQPAHSKDVVNGQFDRGAALVVERDHFDDYLVVGRKTVYRVSHIVEWTFTAKDKSVRKPIFDSAAAVTALPVETREVLVKRYPKFAYIL